MDNQKQKINRHPRSVQGFEGYTANDLVSSEYMTRESANKLEIFISNQEDPSQYRKLWVEINEYLYSIQAIALFESNQ